MHCHYYYCIHIIKNLEFALDFYFGIKSYGFFFCIYVFLTVVSFHNFPQRIWSLRFQWEKLFSWNFSLS